MHFFRKQIALLTALTLLSAGTVCGLPEQTAYAECGQTDERSASEPEQHTDRQRQRRKQYRQGTEGADSRAEQSAEPVQRGMRQAGRSQQQREISPEIGKQQNIQIYRHAITVFQYITFSHGKKSNCGQRPSA